VWSAPPSLDARCHDLAIVNPAIRKRSRRRLDDLGQLPAIGAHNRAIGELDPVGLPVVYAADAHVPPIGV
jgi:hypothetical protein